jgi:hypothetical protein
MEGALASGAPLRAGRRSHARGVGKIRSWDANDLAICQHQLVVGSVPAHEARPDDAIKHVASSFFAPAWVRSSLSGCGSTV